MRRIEKTRRELIKTSSIGLAGNRLIINLSKDLCANPEIIDNVIEIQKDLCTTG
jgi:hypothetical protein